MKTLLALIIATVAWGGVASAQANDASSLGFSLSPAILEIPVEVNTQTTSELRFINNSSQPIGGSLVAETLIPVETVLDQKRRDEFDASSWISFTQSNLVFEPNQQKVIDFTITVPETANPGGHYAQITLRPGIIDPDDQSQTKVLPQISATVFITVAGDAVEEATLVDDRLDIGRVAKNSQTNLSFKIQNTGNTHIVPSPRVSILKDGAVIEVLGLQPQLVLPNTEKEFNVEWTADVGYGSYQVIAETVYGSASIPLVSNTYTAWVTPAWWQVLLVIIIVPSMAYLLFRFKNLPKAMSVLTGRAHLRSANYKGFKSHADHALTKTGPDVASPDEVAAELDEHPLVFGMPLDDSARYKAEIEREATPPKKKPKKSSKKPKKLTSTTVDKGHSTTHITQTTASTIVRETPKPKPITAKKITVKVHDDTPHKSTPKSKKKTTIHKKSGKS